MNANMAFELDVRSLPPPEPFEHIIRALRTLPVEGCLQVYIDREPFPLYEVLLDAGYDWQTAVMTDGSYSIRISRSI